MFLLEVKAVYGPLKMGLITVMALSLIPKHCHGLFLASLLHVCVWRNEAPLKQLRKPLQSGSGLGLFLYRFLWKVLIHPCVLHSLLTQVYFTVAVRRGVQSQAAESGAHKLPDIPAM